MRKIDLTGQRFNRLFVLQEAGKNKHRQILWLCKCDCGNKKTVPGYDLRHDKIKSCGCMQYAATTKHGQKGTRLYKIWEDMKRRCNNSNASSYRHYGGRGIKVCEEWNEFIPFYNWAKESGYKDTLTIDRINVNGNYEPSNCRWATKKQQSRNQRIREDNTSGVRGVSLDKRTGKWGAFFHLGYFDTLEEAEEARKKIEEIFWKSS
ncbi:AP2 domain-containing protein [Bacillus toyonensis]